MRLKRIALGLSVFLAALLVSGAVFAQDQQDTGGIFGNTDLRTLILLSEISGNDMDIKELFVLSKLFSGEDGMGDYNFQDLILLERLFD